MEKSCLTMNLESLMSRNQRRKAEATRTAGSPNLIDQMFGDAVQHHMAGRLPEAEELYLKILMVPPIQSEASYNLGLLYQTSGRMLEAIAAYQKAVTLRQDHVDALNNMGTAFQALGAMDQAIEIYHKAIAIKPEHETTYCNLGVALKEKQKLELSDVSYERAVTLKPTYDWAYANRSAVLVELDRNEEAIEASRRALELHKDMPMALFNLGTALRAENRYEEAEQALRRAVEVNPDFVEGHFTLGQTLLHLGKYEDGWREYEWRWRLAQYSWLKSLHGNFTQPRWEGEDIAGKTLLVYAEQGLGDALQYVRYLPLLAAKTGAKIIFAVHRQLLRLFGQFEALTVIALDQSPLPPFDFHSPLLSLPRILQTTEATIPRDVPYVKADPALVGHWRARIGAEGKKKVGIVWAGNPDQNGDRLRSPQLATVMPFFDVPGIQFIALQMGPGRKELEHIKLPGSVLDLGLEIADFSDTAAIMDNLDLMISSCTAPLHLAAAMGVRTWGVIPFSPHFLWQSDRLDNPWYPSLTLYRQSKAGDWSDLVEAVCRDLRSL